MNDPITLKGALLIAIYAFCFFWVGWTMRKVLDE